MTHTILYICAFAFGFTLSYWITRSIKGGVSWTGHLKAIAAITLILAIAFADIYSKL